MNFLVLDGALGSQLTARGVDTETPLWSARALIDAPELVEQIHREYVAAGATVHRTNTFRTQPRVVGADWTRLAAEAVRRTRLAIADAEGHRIAGSIGPLEDCYRPDLAPPDHVAGKVHGELAAFLRDEGVDLLFCETFPSPREARAATAACVRTGLPTWTSLTAGPNGELMTPEHLATAAASCIDEGAEIVFVNCVAVSRTAAYVDAFRGRGLPFGVYANAADWNRPRATPEQYVQHARAWIDAGARVVGACCGTGPDHVRALAALQRV